MWFFSPVSSSMRSRSSIARSRASSSRRTSRSRRQLDREHAEVALVVEDHGRVPCCSGRLLVRREQRVLERSDERAALDALLALDLAYGVNDLLAHPLLPFVDQVGPHDLLVRDVHRFAVCGDLHRPFPGGDDLAADAAGLGLDAHRAADGADEVVTCAKRAFDARRRDLDAVACRGTGRRTVVTRSQSAWSTPWAWSTKTQKRSLPVSSSASTSTPGSAPSTRRATSRWSVFSLSCCLLAIWKPSP